MKHKTSLLSRFIIGSLLAIMASGSTAYAQDCDSLVVDGAAVFKGELSKVESAAQELVNSGADVRIRTIQTFGSAGSLDNFEKGLEDQCASWQAPDGGRKNNLLVLIVAVKDRKTGLYYGSQWTNALSSGWIRVQTDFMNPRFRDGDFAGGFVAGIGQINQLVYAYIHPPVQPSVIVVPSQPVQPSEPVDLSGLWTVLGWMLVLVAFAGLAYLAFILLREKAKRRTARQGAILVKQAVASRVNELSQAITLAEAGLGVIASKASEDDINPLRETVKKTKLVYDKATGDFGDLSHSAGNLDLTNLTIKEYQNIEARYQKILDSLKEVDELISGVEASTAELEKMLKQVPGDIQKCLDSIKDAIARTQEVNVLGFRTDSVENQFTHARTRLNKVAALYEGKNLRKSLDLLKEISDVVERALAEVENLPRLKIEADAGIAALIGNIEKVKAVIVSGKGIFAEISTNYAQTSWKSVRGNGTEAADRVVKSEELLEEARNMGTMEEQDFNGSLAAIAKAGQLLSEAESLMRSLTALRENLAAAKKDAPKEIELAESDIVKARDYIHKYDDDIKDSLENDLHEAGKLLSSARKEMTEEQPDYPVVVKSAKEANELADKILVEARSEHETVERLRSKAASSLRDATAAVSKAKEYIEDHDSDVKASAKTDIKEAKEYLKRAKASDDLNQQVVLAEKAEKKADSAYSKADKNVDDAEEERRPVYRSSSSSWSSSSSSSWGSSHGGGGSSSFGSSFGGGGSSGFGSSGRGGGGSTGW